MQKCHEIILNYLDIFLFRIIRGGNGLCDGKVSEENLSLVMKRVADGKFGNLKQVNKLSYQVTI
jgi:hypothetical protein